MTEFQIVRAAASVTAAATPWVVARVGLAVADQHARSVGVPFTRPSIMITLARLTTLAVAAAGGLAVWLPPTGLWRAMTDLSLFAALAVVAARALAAIGEASETAREVADPVRMASLQPRCLADHVPLAWRAALMSAAGVGFGAFVWRLIHPLPDRRLLVPVMFAVIAAVFAWLYEVWMRQVAAGGEVPPSEPHERRRRRQLRALFAIEGLLVTCCLVLAHALLDHDWARHAAQGAAAGVVGASIGIVGCALAVASQFARRRYRRV